MSLRTTERGITLIKAFEGCKLTPYKCPAGVWTVGYGHTSKAGSPIVTAVGPVLTSEANALAILHMDIDLFETQIEQLVQGVTIDANQFDALVSFGYNVGVHNLATSTLLKKLKAGDVDGASQQFARWNKITDPRTGQPAASDGLTRRRRAEAALFMGDITDAESYIGMDFGPMVQEVIPPPPPKTMAQSKTGNASLVGVAGTAVLGAKTVISTVQGVVTPVQTVVTSVQTASASVQDTVQQGQQTVHNAQTTFKTVSAVVPHGYQLNPHALAHASIWGLLAVMVMLVLGFVWSDRRKKLHEEGV